MLLNCSAGEDSCESLDCKDIQPVHPEGNQSWIFIGRTDVEAETPILWPPAVKSWLIGKDHDAGKNWGREEKGTMEYEMVGWHHRLNGYGFGWTPGVGDGQRGLLWCSSWGRKETWLSNWNELRGMRWYLFWFTFPWSLVILSISSCFCNLSLGKYLFMSCSVVGIPNNILSQP